MQTIEWTPTGKDQYREMLSKCFKKQKQNYLLAIVTVYINGGFNFYGPMIRVLKIQITNFVLP